jgi:hypothetical protein
MRALLLLLLVTAVPSWAHSDSTSTAEHPKQGLADMLIEYLQSRYGPLDLEGHIIYVSVQRQALYHVRSGRLMAEYPISTAGNGLGSKRDSYRTPTGLHRIREKIGDDVPPFGILKDRVFTGEFADPDFAGVDKDWITSCSGWKDWSQDTTKAATLIATNVSSTSMALPMNVPSGRHHPKAVCACAIPM